MGDVGSLALGGAIGTVAVILKQEILLVSIGGIFILELLSVILQVGSFKLTGQTDFSHGAAASPFRADGMERIEDHRAILDFGAGVRAVFVDDFEIEVRRVETGNRSRGQARAGGGTGAHGRGRVAFRAGYGASGDGHGRQARGAAGRHRRKAARGRSEAGARRASAARDSSNRT